MHGAEGKSREWFALTGKRGWLMIIQGCPYNFYDTFTWEDWGSIDPTKRSSAVGSLPLNTVVMHLTTIFSD